MIRKIHLSLIIADVILLFIAGLLFFLFTVNIIVKQAQARGFVDAKQVYSDLLHESRDSVVPDYQRLVINQSMITDARIIIVYEDARLLADSNLGWNPVTGIYINADISDAKVTGSASSIVRSSRTGDLSVSVAVRKILANEPIIISLIYQIEEDRKLTGLFGLIVLTLTVLTTLLVVLVITYTRRRMRRPIRKLLQHTREAAQGGFYKIAIHTVDVELTQLVENFNSLIDRYNLLIETDNRKYSRINTLMSNLNTGILMVDSRNLVTLVNPEAEKLLNLNKLLLFEVRSDKGFQSRILNEILEKTREVFKTRDHTSFSAETPDGDILDITVEVMVDKYIPYDPSGVLVILRDVTEIRRLEKLKDEFVSNVSHELRTPLTVISGFVETLKSWELLEAGDRNTALNIIEVETERLKKLISELLLLSRIEGEMGQARKRLIVCIEAVNQVLSTLKPLADNKDLITTLEVDDKASAIYGIAGWFRQIVYNLYDNAIKYTPPGGQIWIRIQNEDDYLCLEVEDTGAGIPDVEQARIFERFYRREKSHNSRIAGSGIGLTITSHMVAEFKGTISVSNRPSGGSIFRVTLPCGEEYQNRSSKQDDSSTVKRNT
ncbi:MAG: histidine kinase [Spirochaetales bacterium]|nr:histidine kinase [Spirochaetales bacterium]